jgi:hypothetical protein
MQMTVGPVLLARLLRRMADVIESMDDAELEGFLGNVQPISRTSKIGGSRRAPRNEPRAKMDPHRTSDVVNRLQEARTRDEGASILDQLNLTRRELVAVAHARSVHVTKDDNISRIEEKLVEAIIGSRLNSQAIRGTSSE